MIRPGEEPRVKRSLAHDVRAVSAVEFALILPFLILLYLGGVELTHAVTVDRKVTAATSAVGDLVAQTTQLSDADLENILDAASAILAPYDARILQIIVSSVEVEQNGGKVVWSDSRNAGSYAAGTEIALPPGVAVPDTTVIVAEARYLYQTGLGKVLTDSILLTETFYLRPRASDGVTRVP